MSDKKPDETKRPVGRSPFEYPQPIPDTPERIARAVPNTKPKKKWHYDKKSNKKTLG